MEYFICYNQSALLDILDMIAESFVADNVSTMNLAITSLEYVVMVVRMDIMGSSVIAVRYAQDVFSNNQPVLILNKRCLLWGNAK